MPYTQRQSGSIGVNVQVDGGAEGGDEPWRIVADAPFSDTDMDSGPQTGDTTAGITTDVWQGRDYTITYGAKPGGGYNLPSPNPDTLTATASDTFTGNYTDAGGSYVRPPAPAYGEHVLGTNYDVPLYWGGAMFKNILNSGEAWKNPNNNVPIPIADVKQDGNLATLASSGSGHAVSRMNVWETGPYNIEVTGVGEFYLNVDSVGSGYQEYTATGGDATFVFTPSGFNDYDEGFLGLYVTALGSPPLEFKRIYHQKYAATVENGNPLIQSRIDDAQYYGALRMMDWTATASTEYEGWPNCTSATQANYYEYCRKSYLEMIQVHIDIANHMHRDLWVNIMHRFGDASIDLILEKIEAPYVPGVNGGGLDPSLKWYCEFSNEIWNGSMPGQWYSEEQGTAERDAGNPLFSGGLSDFEATHRFQVWRSKQIWDRMAAHATLAPVWNTRCVRVLAGWLDTVFVLDSMLNAISDDGVKYAKAVDAIAINPYMWPGPCDQTNPWSTPPRNTTIDTMDQVFQWLDATHGELDIYMASHRSLVDSLPSGTSDTLGTMDVLCYEGGQHVFVIDEDSISQNHLNLIANAQKDSRMGPQYDWLLSTWSSYGFGMFCHFTDAENPGAFGGWGTRWDTKDGDDGYPKWHSLLDWQDSEVNP